MSDRQGIEIDYCPKCRGVWLDRGELDKIIERSAAAAPAPSAPPPPPAPTAMAPGGNVAPAPQPRWDSSPDHWQGGPGGYRKKRKSFLGEIFDF